MDRLDREFLRFQHTGDPDALAEVFDATAPGLLRVAGSLVRDAGVAEDLVQETFTVAITRRDGWHRKGSVRHWLTGILVRRAHKRRRADGRDPDPDRLRLVESADPARDAESVELREAVREGIGKLAEPYRPLLHAHLERGMRPQEIARELDRSPAVVRKQLSRGIELLRRVLPAGLAGSLVVSIGAPRGLAAVRQDVLDAARDVGPSAAASSETWATAVVGKKGLIAVVVALGMIGFGLHHLLEPRVGPSSEIADRRAFETAAVEPVGSALPRTLVDSARTEERSPTDPGELEVVVLEAESGAPAPRVGVLVRPRNGTNEATHTVRGVTDGTGRVVLPVAGGAHLVEIDRRGPHGPVAESVELAPGDRFQVTIRAPRGRAVVGRVVDAVGAPVSGADVWLHYRLDSANREDPPAHAVVAAVSDVDGAFRIEQVGLSALVQARRSGSAPSLAFQLRDQQQDPETQLTLALRGPAATLRGIVAAGGAPAPHAQLELVWADRSVLTRWHDRFVFSEDAWVDRRFTADELGRFELDDLPAGEATLVARVPGCAPAGLPVHLRAAKVASVAIAAEVAGALRGLVVDDGGRPVVGATASVTVAGIEHRAWTDAEGVFVLDDLPPGTVALRVRSAGHFGRALQATIEAGAAREVAVTLEPLAWLRGRVLDPLGDPLGGQKVFCRRLEAVAGAGAEDRGRLARGRWTRTRSDADGRFALGVAPGIRHAVFVVHEEGDIAMRDEAWQAVVAPCDEMVFRIPEAELPSAYVDVRLLDAAGQPLIHASFDSLQRQGSGLPARPVGDLGGYRIGPLKPGPLRIEVKLPFTERIRFMLPAVELEPYARVDLGAQRAPAPEAVARVDVRVRDVEGRPIRDAHLGIRRVAGGLVELSGGPGQATVPASLAGDPDGRIRASLRPGRFRLLVSANGYRSRMQIVELEPGASWSPEIMLPRAVERVVVSALPRGEERATLTLRGPDGTEVGLFDAELPARGDALVRKERPAPDAWRLWLEPGVFEAELRGASGRRWSGRVVVDELAADEEPIEIAWSPR